MTADTFHWRHAGQVPRAKFQEPRDKETRGSGYQIIGSI